MDDLLGRLVPLALGVAASPLPVVAVLVILLTKRARFGSIVFASCWVLGTSLALLLSMAFASQVSAPPAGIDLPFEGLIAVLLGGVLASAALIARRERLRSGDPHSQPPWVERVDNLSPAGGALIALSNAMMSPKNLALTIAAGLSLHNAGVSGAERAGAALVYVACASIFVAAPVVVYFAGGEQVQSTLERWKFKIASRAGSVVEIALFVLGIVLAGKGAYNLLGHLL